MIDYRETTLMSQRISKLKSWIEENTSVSNNDVSLVCSLMSALDVFYPKSRHVVFYQLPADPILVMYQIGYLRKNGYKWVEYKAVREKGLEQIPPGMVSFATGTVLEPPFPPSTFDKIFFDFQSGMMPKHHDGFGHDDRWLLTALGLAEYLEKLKIGGDYFARLPALTRDDLKAIPGVLRFYVEEHCSSRVEKVELVETSYEGLYGFDVFLKATKCADFKAMEIRKLLRNLKITDKSFTPKIK